MSTVKERTILFVKQMKLQMKEFEQRCKLSPGYVTSMRKSFGADKLQNVLDAFPELNREWLLFGEGEMLKQPKEQQNIANVPLIPLHAYAGSLTGYAENGVQLIDCERIISPIIGADFAVTVDGESMSPEYPNGSIVLIKRYNPNAFIEWGKVFVLDTCNGIVIKKVTKTDDTNIVRCSSLNPSYDDFTVDTHDIFGWYRVLSCICKK